MPLGLEVGLRLGRRGFFKADGGRREGTPDLAEAAEPTLAPPLPAWLLTGGFSRLPLGGALLVEGD